MPSNSEWLQIATLFFVGPAFALSLFVLAAVAFFSAARWSPVLRGTVLAVTALMAVPLIAAELSWSRGNSWVEEITRPVAACEVAGALALAVVLLTRRKHST